MTNAQRRAARHANSKAKVNSLSLSDHLTAKLAPQSVSSGAFCPHESGVYYIATVGTVGTFKMFAKDIKPPVYTYGITTIRFELNPATGTWIWFNGEKNLFPRKTHDGWRLGSRRLHATREDAEAEVQQAMVKNGDRVTKVHDLPDDMTALKKIRSANHPDRNANSDVELYQAVVEKLDRMRTATL